MARYQFPIVIHVEATTREKAARSLSHVLASVGIRLPKKMRTKTMREKVK